MELYYVDRKTGEKKKEVVAGGHVIQWLYDTKTGQNLLELILKRKITSALFGKIYSLPFSKSKIAKFIEEMEINLKEAEKDNIKDYRSFNDFFIRKLKKDVRPMSQDPCHLISPCDGRMLAYEHIDIHQLVQVKGQTYSLQSLLQDNQLANQYQGGTCVVIRLNPSDYHRFHFPDSGIASTSKRIKGNYYSVNPMVLAKIPELYCQNKREFTIFQSDNFGQMTIVEVGATCVGTIVQTYTPEQHVSKGEEKGYFKFGGSTVIFFIKAGIVKIDEDILANSRLSLETKVDMGETIGVKKN